VDDRDDGDSEEDDDDDDDAAGSAFPSTFFSATAVGEGVPPSEHELGERRPSSTPAMMRASLLDSCFDGTT
jgi:hypothetical protein